VQAGKYVILHQNTAGVIGDKDAGFRFAGIVPESVVEIAVPDLSSISEPRPDMVTVREISFHVLYPAVGASIHLYVGRVTRIVRVYLQIFNARVFNARIEPVGQRSSRIIAV